MLSRVFLEARNVFPECCCLAHVKMSDFIRTLSDCWLTNVLHAAALTAGNNPQLRVHPHLQPY